MKLKELLDWGRKKLDDQRVISANLDAEVLLCAVTNLNRTQLFLQHEVEVDTDVMTIFRQYIEERAQHKPVAYIIGIREFMGIIFKVNRHTLIPRPDSESMVEYAIEFMPDVKHPYRALDLGAGSGCLSLSLISRYPNATATLLDYDTNTLDVAKENASLLNLKSRVDFVLSHWCDALEPNRKYDIILCNPPYIDAQEDLMPDVVLYEPHRALFAGDQGYECYQQIAEKLHHHMCNGSVAFFEVGAGQARKVEEIFARNGYKILGIKKDLNSIERVIALAR
jgi:release factor glutamine methyltransferase